MRWSYRVSGLNGTLRRLSFDSRSTLRAITWGIGEVIRNVVAQYPRPPHYPLRWASRKQKLAYVAMRRALGLPLKYTRQFDPMSQRLGPSWTVARYGDLGAKVATRVTYAPHVQAADRQQPFHQETGWVTDRQAVEAVLRSGDIKRIAEAAVRRMLGL